MSRLIDSLERNEPFGHSPIFVYCDGPRGESEIMAVQETRSTVRAMLGARAEIIERSTNQGLARSIISGVSELCRQYGRVIVLEDDLVLHPGCLGFLNGALDRYAEEDRVYHVNAYRFPVPRGAAPCFSRLASSWGWATWARAWARFEPNAALLADNLRRSGLLEALDFGGTYPYHRMLQDQIAGKVDSWAIRWYASVLLNGGLAVVPGAAQAGNRGFDNTGVHCGVTSNFDVELGFANQNWPAEVREDMLTYRQMQHFFRSIRDTFSRRVVRRLRRMLVSQ